MKQRGCLIRGIQVAAILFVVLAVFIYGYLIYPFWGMPFNAQRHGPPPITPPWALECWLWEDDVNTEAYVEELLQGSVEHDIPVRTILIDSPWSTRYNDFTVDEARYPEPKKFFKGLEDRGYRVVLWMTCMVNSRSSDTAIQDSSDWYNEARRKGYLTGGGSQWKWWKGTGGFIDYTNPEALDWWRHLQDQVLDLGIDGWKLDGADTLFFGKLFGKIPVPYQRAYGGWMTTRQYMDHYARDEYHYGLEKNPEFITLIRSMDTPYPHPEGFAPIDAAPVTWVGDRTHDWKTAAPGPDGHVNDKDLMMKSGGSRGFEAALRDILLSAKRGYCVVGDDIGGYHGSSLIPPRLYIRWAEFAAFTGLFLNGGHGERRLWKRTEDELEIIRKFSWLHTELVPYMYTHVVLCHEGGKPLMRPVKGKYHYYFGDDFLVAPIYRDSLANTVTLPAGSWRYLFRDQEVIDGPKTLTRDFPLNELSVYVRDGAIVPLNVERAYTGLGDKDSAGYVTWLIYPRGTNRFTLHNPDQSGTTTVEVVEKAPQTAGDARQIEVTVSGTKKPHILRILMPGKPTQVTLDGKGLQENDAWRYDPADQHLCIRTKDYTEGRYVIVSGQ